MTESRAATLSVVDILRLSLAAFEELCRLVEVNRVSGRGGVRSHVAFIRPLRSYIEQHLTDLVDINKFEPVVGEGPDDYGRDDVVEAYITINGQCFCFYAEGNERSDDDTKPCGLLGVLHEGTGTTVKGSIDGAPWERIEAFVRFAANLTPPSGEAMDARRRGSMAPIREVLRSRQWIQLEASCDG
jgi:hypothetical protein